MIGFRGVTSMTSSSYFGICQVGSRFGFGSLHLGAKLRRLLIWLHWGLQVFTGDGKNNIYSKLICKLHFQFQVWNRHHDCVLPDRIRERSPHFKEDQVCRLFLRGPQTLPTPLPALF